MDYIYYTSDKPTRYAGSEKRIWNMQILDTVTIHEAAQAITRGTLTSTALVTHCLETIAKDDHNLNAIITLAADALEEAGKCDAEADAGSFRGPLHGIPLLIKDNIDVRGMATTMASPLFAYAAPDEFDAPVITKLKKAGAIILGKSNMDELAAHISGKTSFFGPTYNPWQIEKKLSPGGSSSGTAAATAAGFCLGGLGTDTGGSVRVPAGWCGLCGIRPTYGQTNMAGVYPRSKSLDVVGPLGRSIRDVELLLQVIAEDALAAALRTPSPVTFSKLRVGIFPGFHNDAAPEVSAVYDRVISSFKELGAGCVSVELPGLDDASVVDAVNIIRSFEFARDIAADAEESSGLGQMHPIPFADYQKGKSVPVQTYEEALGYMEILGKQVHHVFNELNIHTFLLPTALFTAPPSTADIETFAAGRRLMNLFSITEVPTVVFRGGLADNGLPVGMQLVGPRLSERLLLDTAEAYELVHGGFQSPCGL